MINPLELSGRTILVTGASSGIGRAIAVLSSRLGARLVLTGRDESRLAETQAMLDPGDHVVAPYDLGRTAELTAWTRDLVKKHGPFGGVVHSAAVQRSVPIRVLSSKVIEDHWQTNVVAAVMILKALQAPGAAAPGCSVVLLSSTAAVTACPGNSIYAATKGAVSSLTRSLALEFLHLGIRVNCIEAGVVNTPMAVRGREDISPEKFDDLVSKHPMGIGQPEDVANAAAFLLSGASRWVTGTSLAVDGGYTAL